MVKKNTLLQKEEIFTETDHLIQELQDELGSLKHRVRSLEDEKEKVSLFYEEAKSNSEYIEKIYSQYQKNIWSSNESIQVMAQVMKSLKTPVINVTSNLKDILLGIPDKEIQNSLNGCIMNLEEVIAHFNETTDYLEKLGENPDNFKMEERDLKKFLQNKLDRLSYYYDKIEFLYDKNIVPIITMHFQLLEGVFDSIFKDFIFSIPNKEGVTMRTYFSEDKEFQEKILCIDILSQKTSGLIWNKLWQDSLDYSYNDGTKIPMKWFYWKKILEKIQGKITFVTQEKNILGLQVCLPYKQIIN